MYNCDWWFSSKRISSASSHWNVTCPRHDIAESLFI